MMIDICGGEASKFSIVQKIKDERKIIDLEPELIFKSYWIFKLQSAEIVKIFLH